MNRCLLLFIIVSLFSCKEKLSKPYSYIDLHINGSEREIIWEEIEADWNITTGEAKVYASFAENFQFSLLFNNIIDTGHIAVSHPNSVILRDPDCSCTYLFTAGTINIKMRDSPTVSGTFNVVMENEQQSHDKQNIEGVFGITR